jgi:hypothetical protein
MHLERFAVLCSHPLDRPTLFVERLDETAPKYGNCLDETASKYGSYLDETAPKYGDWNEYSVTSLATAPKQSKYK